jgi:hypothetical protein
MSTEGSQPYNPAAVGAMQQQVGGPGTIAGGRGLGGLLPADTPGFLNGGQGIFGKHIVEGGVFSLNSANKKPPGILSQLGLTPTAMMESLKQIAKTDPVIQGGMQAVAQQMSGGVQSMATGTTVSPSGIPQAGGGMEIS